MKRYLSNFLILAIGFISFISCDDAPTYDAEITVINFLNKKVVYGATVTTGVLDPVDTKDLHSDIEQTGKTDEFGKVKFTFKHKANIHFKIKDPATDMEGETNIKLVEDENIKKKVYIYKP